MSPPLRLSVVEQWALNGFSVAYNPPTTSLHRALLLLWRNLPWRCGLCMVYDARHADWGSGTRFHAGYNRLHSRTQLVPVGAVAAAVVSLLRLVDLGSTGSGAYRRLGTEHNWRRSSQRRLYLCDPDIFITMGSAGRSRYSAQFSAGGIGIDCADDAVLCA